LFLFCFVLFCLFCVIHFTPQNSFHTTKTQRITTTLGDLNIELHCDLVPKTTENFIGLCEKGYYDNTIFHRLIPNFMVK